MEVIPLSNTEPSMIFQSLGTMTGMERQILPSGEKAMATGISRTPPMEVIPLSNWETSMIS
jgi:hypothetical protein